jgi:hypothetical protein
MAQEQIAMFTVLIGLKQHTHTHTPHPLNPYSMVKINAYKYINALTWEYILH